jgi:hypothetical protein
MTLYILGAGFSKAFCHDAPLIKDYFINVKSSRIKKVLKEYRKIGIKTNESLSSILLDDSYIFNYKDKLERQIDGIEFIQLIANRLRSLVPDDRQAFFNYISNNMLNNQNNKIVTFNYDTLIEDHFGDNLPYEIALNGNPFEGGLIDGGIYGNYNSILKLHGSVNWFKYSDTSHADLSNIFFCTKDQASYKSLIEKQTPIIVPFSFNRKIFLEGDIFDLMWKRFDQLLSDCTNIEILGYSFPESDYLIIGIISKYYSKISRVIVKENSKEKLNRLNKLFHGKLDNNGIIA